MGLSSVMAVEGSVNGKRKAEGELLEMDDNGMMGLPTLKPIIARKTCAQNQNENSVEDTDSKKKTEVGCDNEGCETPRSQKHKIPPCLECPPAPRKPRPVARKKPATIPGGFFFVPPDLESVFYPYRIRPTKKLHWSAEPAWIGVSVEDKII